jgi:hypothetical protein
MERDAPFLEPLIYSFIYSYLSEYPLKELSQETGGRHMVTTPGALSRWKAYIQ